MQKDIEYENNNIAFDWQCTEKDGGGIKCKNYELCESVLPKWWFDCKGCYLCTNCDMMFGTWKNEAAGIYKTGKGVLDVYDNVECPICLDMKRSVSQPNCEHTLCIDCFKRCYYGENEPTFPYPDIEDEYYDDSEHPKWDTEYPFIQIYNNEWEEWDDKKNRNEEEHLQRCPLCRK